MEFFQLRPKETSAKALLTYLTKLQTEFKAAEVETLMNAEDFATYKVISEMACCHEAQSYRKHTERRDMCRVESTVGKIARFETNGRSSRGEENTTCVQNRVRARDKRGKRRSRSREVGTPLPESTYRAEGFLQG